MTSNGDFQLTDEAINDTGPIFNLYEIDTLYSFYIFERKEL
jgi:hypothetical protein